MLDLALDVSLRSVAAAAAVALVLAALRVRSGAARHAAWSAVLLTMLTMPVLLVVVPRVDVLVPVSLATSFDTIADDGASYPRPEMPATHAVGQPPSVAGANPAVDAKVRPAGVLDARTVATVVYGAGVLLFLIQIVAGWLVARRLVRGAISVSCDGHALVCETTAITTPMTAGLLRRCVLLPTGWREWPEDKRRAVLAHENAHIARHDSLAALFARVNRAIFWFHPLAWWLDRTLAVAAEHACDEIAVRQVGQPRRYAEVLLDMADVVRRRGHRVSWQTLGVDGAGLLGRRIDRLLKGDVMTRMSTAKRAALVVGCAAVLLVAVACHQQIAAAPLRADPGIQKQLDERKARMERDRAALAMTPQQAAALERSLGTNPDNFQARESLIIYYDQSGKPTWAEKVAGIRRHSLWRIAHLPETDLWIPNISKRYDPDGYAQAKTLWLEQTSKPDVTANTLARAASFFAEDDKPMAEGLLIRAARMEAAGPWTGQLMDLYAQAIAASADPRYQGRYAAGAQYLTPDAADAQSAFAADARRTIEASTDPTALANAGFALSHWARPRSEPAALARRLLERAAARDPRNVRARTGLADFENSDRWRSIRDRLRAVGAPNAFDDFGDTTAAAVSALPIEDRLFYLPGAAESAYMRAEYIDYTAREKPAAEQAQARRRAAEGFARARQYANDALALARTNDGVARANDVAYRAETALGVLALKDGDRKAAVEHMHTAVAAPMPDPARYVSSSGLRSRLAEYLLRAGERASVADYLEKSAQRSPIERDQLRRDAARIREGMMPLSYQYAQADR